MLKNKWWSPLLVAAGVVAVPAWSAETPRSVIVVPMTEPEIVVVEMAPPPLRAEDVPAPREGYFWSPGYWSYNGTTYVWIDGRILPEQAGWINDTSMPNPLGKARVNPLQPSPGA
jgi:hypothetical protein